jgi:hypothetical protein
LHASDEMHRAAPPYESADVAQPSDGTYRHVCSLTFILFNFARLQYHSAGKLTRRTNETHQRGTGFASITRTAHAESPVPGSNHDECVATSTHER